jgi:hypothetical protein
VLIKDEGAFNT